MRQRFHSTHQAILIGHWIPRFDNCNTRDVATGMMIFHDNDTRIDAIANTRETEDAMRHATLPMATTRTLLDNFVSESTLSIVISGSATWMEASAI